MIVELVREGLKAKADTAQVRQTVTREYPAVKGANSNTSGLFSSKDFGPGQTFSHDRVAFVDIPKGLNKDEAQAKLDNFPNSCIYKKFSYNVLDVMNDDQIEAMETGFSGKDIAFYEEKYAVLDGNKEVVVEDGSILYSSSHFMQEFKEDMNLRNADANRVSIATEATAVTKEETTAKVEM